MSDSPLAAWHHIVVKRDASGLEAILADDVVFYSPVVHTPQKGKAITQGYLTAATFVLGGESFRYVRELEGDGFAVLEFEVEVEGILINGVDMISWNDEGRITEFKVMLRPLKAIQLVHQQMGAMLARKDDQPSAAAP